MTDAEIVAELHKLSFEPPANRGILERKAAYLIERLQAEKAEMEKAADVACDRAYCEGMRLGRNLADDDERFDAAYNARRREIAAAMEKP